MWKHLPRGKYSFFLLCLAAMFFLLPFAEMYRFTAMDALMLVVLIAGVYAISRNRSNVITGLALAAPCLIADVGIAASADPTPGYLRIASMGSYTVFLSFVILGMLNTILGSQRVSGDTISGAVCVYLAIALLWANLYGMIDLADPHAFAIVSDEAEDLYHRKHLIYFSLVTLTTLGYGDITPASDIARSVTTLEAVVGQLFLVILIARLVGIHLMHWTGREDMQSGGR
jgi:hypothetical protein